MWGDSPVGREDSPQAAPLSTADSTADAASDARQTGAEAPPTEAQPGPPAENGVGSAREADLAEVRLHAQSYHRLRG